MNSVNTHATRQLRPYWWRRDSGERVAQWRVMVSAATEVDRCVCLTRVQRGEGPGDRRLQRASKNSLAAPLHEIASSSLARVAATYNNDRSRNRASAAAASE